MPFSALRRTNHLATPHSNLIYLSLPTSNATFVRVVIYSLSNATLFLDIDPLKNRNAKDHKEDKNTDVGAEAGQQGRLSPSRLVLFVISFRKFFQSQVES